MIFSNFETADIMYLINILYQLILKNSTHLPILQTDSVYPRISLGHP